MYLKQIYSLLRVRLTLDSKTYQIPEESEKSIGSLETQYKDKKNEMRAELTQIGELVVRCMTIQVANDYESKYQKLLSECVGTNFNLLDREFYKMMFQTRDLFKELVIKELEPFKDGHEDVVNYMMYMIAFLAERNFKMLKGFRIFKQRANLYITETIILEVRFVGRVIYRCESVVLGEMLL